MIRCKKVMYPLLGMVSIFLFIVGCQSIPNEGQNELMNEPEYNKPQDPSTFGDLPSLVGNDEFITPFEGEFNFQINENIEHLSYNAPTGEWFMADGQGVFGYTIPNGSIGAEEQFEVGLIHATQDSNVMERNVRVQLTPCEKDFSCLEPIVNMDVYVNAVDHERILYKGTMPPRENQLYVLSMEVLHEDIVEDTLISYVYVPEETINASIEMDSNTDEHTRSFTLTNYGPTFLFISEEYTIEQLIDDTWMVVPYQTMIPDIAIYVKPGGTYTHTVDVSTFPRGTYRFLKHIQADIFDLNETIAVQFEIE